jgi:oligosaccharide repeat unit polymerase
VSYCVATFVALLNYEYWGVNYSFYLTAALLLCIMSIGFGELLSRGMFNKIFEKNNSFYVVDINFRIRNFHPSKILLFVIFVIGVLTCYFSYKQFLSIALMAGYSGTGYMMEFVRNVYLFSDYPKNYLIVILSYLQTGVAYVITLIVINNFVVGQHDKRKFRDFIKNNIGYFVMLIPFFLLAVLTTGRAIFMQFACYAMFVYLVTYQKAFKFKKIRLRKLIKIAFISMISFLLVFFMLGLLTGKSNSSQILDTLSTYIGSSIPGLNHHLVTVAPEKEYQIFYGIKTFMNRFGAHFPISEALYRNDITFPNNGGTNIYTAIWLYYSDFGWMGIIVFNVILGWFVTLLEKFSKNSMNGLWIILYGYYGYFLVRQIIAESFISYILTTTRIFDLLSIILCYFLLYRPTLHIFRRNDTVIGLTTVGRYIK